MQLPSNEDNTCRIHAYYSKIPLHGYEISPLIICTDNRLLVDAVLLNLLVSTQNIALQNSKIRRLHKFIKKKEKAKN